MHCRGERLGVGKPSETISIIQMSPGWGRDGMGLGEVGEGMGDTVEGDRIYCGRRGGRVDQLGGG